MSDALTWLLAWAAGGLLGTLFFGGLWWTVRKSIGSAQPALWFLGSLLVRMSVTLLGFYFVARGDWHRLLLCLFGLLMARGVVERLTRATAGSSRDVSAEASHAP
ncbi:MAG TPA: ATP synthase subunit I [Polyangiales bacterium]